MKNRYNLPVKTLGLALALTASSFMISGCGLWKSHSSKISAPAPVLPIPTPEQMDWQKLETYAFVHFGLNTFNDLEWGYGNTPASTFNPKRLDCDQWARIIKAAGFKGILLTAKHHDGFCLWPTKTTEYSVKNSPWKDGKGDMVKDLSEACQRHNLKFGIYLSPWDRNSEHYGTPKYVEIFHEQMRELLTNYGPIFEYWFDGANGGNGWYGGADTYRNIDPKTYYRYEEAKKMIRQLHPSAMIFGGTVPDIRWIGNEIGYAGETNWSPMNIGEAEGRKNMVGQENGSDWLPGECDVSIRPGWFYHHREDHQVKSPAKLMDIYYGSVGRNATLLLNFPVDLNGTIHPKDSASIMEWKALLDQEFATPLLAGKATAKASNVRDSRWSAANVLNENYDSYWATSDGVSSAELIISLPTETSVNRLMLQEYIPLGQRVKKFSVLYKKGEEWLPVTSRDAMTTIGYKRLLRFASVKTDALKIVFEESRGPLCINRVEAYMAPAIVSDLPMIRRGSNDEVSIFVSAPGLEIYYTVDGSTPTPSNGIKYDKPFILRDRGIVKAIAHDPDFGKSGDVAEHNFYLSSSRITVLSPQEAGTKEKLFDGNPYSLVRFPKGEKVLELLLDAPRKISGFKLWPNQQRDGNGHIHSYILYVDDVKVQEGEFSNIKNNPVLQTVQFAPVKGQKVKLVAKEVVDNVERVVLSDFDLIIED
ncbi:MAG: alpha-L-fucosidase [Porphyromonas sp.]|nr:alpha-L-fucosidase [Porphyromonas sp.]